QVVEKAGKHGLKIIGDPKGADFRKYKGFSALTPNKKEASIATGKKLTTPGEYESAAKKILRLFSGEALLITRGSEGMSLFTKKNAPVHISTVAKEVFDVTGAGDTVISVFSAGLFFGLDIADAVRLSNVAAGLEVGKVGSSVVTLKEISEYVDGAVSEQKGKVIDRFELDQIVSRAKNNGNTIVFTNGCFDLMHLGHLQYLKKAKSFGDILIVGLNSDSSVRSLKGPKRPLITEHERSSLLAALDCVNYVYIFSEKTPEALIKKIGPDVLVKGGDYSLDQVVGRSIVENNGGRVELVPVVKGMSTTGLVEKIVAKYRK
ncbi:MAG: D-glycero-beta-D-manno-heptose 1-phosphate adenylyltransferase, partial [Nitrospinota bacterium]